MAFSASTDRCQSSFISDYQKIVEVSLLQSVDGAPLTRITALDAAGPGFWSTVPGQLPPRPRPLAPPAPPQQRLDRGDAELVQAIHTNTGNMGARPRLGHLDLYIGGTEAGAGTTDYPHSVCCALGWDRHSGHLHAGRLAGTLHSRYVGAAAP